MKLDTRTIAALAGLVMSIGATPALAQVAPPPSEKPAEETPAAEPAPETQAQPETRPVNQPRVTSRPAGVKQLNTDVPYPKLASKGEDGKIIRLAELPGIVALKANPNVGESAVDRIMPILYGRRARFEHLVIQNLDLYWLATDGRLESVSLSDVNELAQLAELIKPLVGKSTLSQELQNRGILSRTQAEMNSHIVNEYKQAITTEIQFNAEDPMSEVMRFVLQDSIHEASIAYNAMMAEASTNTKAIVERAGLSSPAAKQLASLEKPLAEDPATQHAQLDRFDQAFRDLSIDEGIAFLRAMRSLREVPDLSPMVQRIDVSRPGKVDVTGTDAFEGNITTRDGRVISTKEARERAQENQAKKQAEYEEKLRQQREANKQNNEPKGDD
jgi:hypothetical protein